MRRKDIFVLVTNHGLKVEEVDPVPRPLPVKSQNIQSNEGIYLTWSWPNSLLHSLWALNVPLNKKKLRPSQSASGVSIWGFIFSAMSSHIIGKS